MDVRDKLSKMRNHELWSVAYAVGIATKVVNIQRISLIDKLVKGRGHWFVPKYLRRISTTSSP
jgi:hypothetical protein